MDRWVIGPREKLRDVHLKITLGELAHESRKSGGQFDTSNLKGLLF
jgi:hypothetical protein